MRAWVLVVVAVAAQVVRAQPSVNLAIPGFSQVFNLGGSTKVTHRWWFWLLIGLLSAFSVVMGYFSWRGCRHWRAYRACKASIGPGAVVNVERVGIELAESEEGKSADQKEASLGTWKPRFQIDWAAVEHRTGTPAGLGQHRHSIAFTQGESLGVKT